MKVYTYIEPQPEFDERLPDLWAQNWRSKGFVPMIMNEADAIWHPLYSAWRDDPWLQISGLYHSPHCFLRYLAVENKSREDDVLFVEPDVFNFGLSVEEATEIVRACSPNRIESFGDDGIVAAVCPLHGMISCVSAMETIRKCRVMPPGFDLAKAHDMLAFKLCRHFWWKPENLVRLPTQEMDSRPLVHFTGRIFTDPKTKAEAIIKWMYKHQS